MTGKFSRVRLLVTLLSAACALSACAALHSIGDALEASPRINDNVFTGRNGGLKDDHSDIPAVIPIACRGYSTDGIEDPLTLQGTSPTKIAENNRKIEEHVDGLTGDALVKCTDAMKSLIDMRFARFEHVVNASISTGNFLIDTSVLGLSTSIPLVAPGTARVLGAIAAGMAGSRKNFDEDVLYSYSIQTILQQMRTDRAAQAAVIDSRLTNTTHPYRDMYEAAADLFEYDQAGSWDHAMVSLQTNVAAQTAACQARLRDQKMAGSTDAPATSQAGPPPATDPCTPPPPKPPVAESVTIKFGPDGKIAAGQATVLDQVAAMITAGLVNKTISGVTIQGQTLPSEANGEKLATDRAMAVLKELTKRHIDIANIVIDKTINVNGGQSAVISFRSVDAVPAEQGAQSGSTSPAPKTEPPATDSQPAKPDATVPSSSGNAAPATDKASSLTPVAKPAAPP